LKQIIKIQGRLGHPDEMVEAYRQLLQYASVVTRNAAEKKINSVLDYVSAQATDSRLLQVGGGGSPRCGWRASFC
jgi:putative NADH-flavin reductase